MSQLGWLIGGLVIFLGGHIAIRAGDTRQRLIAHFGERVYHALFSLVALMGLAMIVHGFGLYRAMGMIPVWSPPRFLNHLAVLLMLVSLVALAATWLPGRIRAALKHPMLVSIKIWAFAHLLVNGDLGSIILFGAFLAWAVYARIAIKRSGDGEIIPGTGMGEGSLRNDMIAVALGIAGTLATIYFLHQKLIGVPIL